MKNFINDFGKKKLLIIAGAAVGLIILIIVLLLVVNSFKKNTYQDVENKVLDAAKKYYKENVKLLPQNINDEVSINSTTLESNGYLKDLNKLVPDKDVNCSATVTVTNINNSYRYTTKLKCGNKYETQTLADKIINAEGTVISGQGLYEINGGYAYRGENPNNNLTFAGKKWRIVKIEDDSVAIILNEKYVQSVWDNRYNQDRNQNDGINDYSVSRANDFLTNAYKDESFIKNGYKNLIIAHNLYVGKRGSEITFNDGSLEKSEVIENKYLGLLPLFDYVNASLDTNCVSSKTKSCANYNYLANYGYNWWTMTGDADNTYKVYKINNQGKIEGTRAATGLYLRPVVYLAKDAIYVGGNGTFDNPYLVK